MHLASSRSRKSEISVGVGNKCRDMIRRLLTEGQVPAHVRGGRQELVEGDADDVGHGSLLWVKTAREAPRARFPEAGARAGGRGARGGARGRAARKRG